MLKCLRKLFPKFYEIKMLYKVSIKLNTHICSSADSSMYGPSYIKEKSNKYYQFIFPYLICCSSNYKKNVCIKSNEKNLRAG